MMQVCPVPQPGQGGWSLQCRLGGEVPGSLQGQGSPTREEISGQTHKVIRCWKFVFQILKCILILIIMYWLS